MEVSAYREAAGRARRALDVTGRLPIDVVWNHTLWSSVQEVHYRWGVVQEVH